MAMTSFEFTKNALCAFLKKDGPGIIALKGNWGVGKTFLWKETLNEFPAKENATFSYVSLFGISTVDKLRRTIVSRRAPLPKSATSRSRIVQKGVKAASMLRYIDIKYVKSTELFTDAIEEGLMRDMIVCIDDLERKEADFSEHTLLGFITSLRDEKNCKVVLLYNEEEVSKNKSIGPTLAEYREKVIDAEVTLQPTANECYDLVFGKGEVDLKPLPQSGGLFFAEDSRTIREIFDAGKVANIRVLRRTRETLAYFKGRLDSQFPLQWPAFARQIVKLCILHFMHGNEFQLREILEKDRWVQMQMDRRENKETGEQDRFQSVYDLSFHPSDTDALISDYLITGYVDFAGYGALLDKAEGTFRQTELGVKLRENWNLLWDNFRAPQEEFILTQTVFLKENFAKIGLSEIGQFASVAKMLGDYPEIQEMLERKISEFVIATQDLEDHEVMYLTTVPTEVAERVFSLRATQSPIPKPIREAIAAMSGRDAWSPNDIRFLTKYSEDDFYQWLLSETKASLLSNLKIFRQRIPDNETGEGVRKKLENALRRLAARSKIDEFRVTSGVDLSVK